jgi:hypothetical protein
MNESNGWRAAGGRMTCSGARGEEADGEEGRGEDGGLIDGGDERRERRGRERERRRSEVEVVDKRWKEIRVDVDGRPSDQVHGDVWGPVWGREVPRATNAGYRTPAVY